MQKTLFRPSCRIFKLIYTLLCNVVLLSLLRKLFLKILYLPQSIPFSLSKMVQQELSLPARTSPLHPQRAQRGRKDLRREQCVSSLQRRHGAAASLLSSLHNCRFLPLGLGVFRLLPNGKQTVDRRKDMKSRSYRGQCYGCVQRQALKSEGGQTLKSNS